MSIEIQFISDKGDGLSKAKGSDGRLNVSSRSDPRSYYNSRDESQAFSLVWDDASSEAGDFILYWKNTNANGKRLVIESVGFNSELAASFKLHIVSGTASGTTVTPTCLNRAVPESAAAVAIEAAGTAITGLTSSFVIDHASVGADGTKSSG